MSSTKPGHAEPLAVIASEDADYERLGLARDVVAPWEDGARTENRRGTYEWWYFDAHLDDGSSLVVVFMNKDLAAPNDPLTPTIRVDLDLADGGSYQKLVTYAPESWQASTEGADARIGGNRFSGDLHTLSHSGHGRGDRRRRHARRPSACLEARDRLPALWPRAGRGVRLAAIGSSGCCDCHLSNRRGGARDDRRRIPRPQLGQRQPHEDHPRLVLGSRSGRTVLRHRLARHGAQALRLRRATHLHARPRGQGGRR